MFRIAATFLGLLVLGTGAFTVPEGSASFGLVDFEKGQDGFAGFHSPLAKDTILVATCTVPAQNTSYDWWDQDLKITIANSPVGKDDENKETTSAILSRPIGNLTDDGSAWDECVYVIIVDDPEFHTARLEPEGSCGAAMDMCSNDFDNNLGESPCSNTFSLPESCIKALGSYTEHKTIMNSSMINHDGFFTYKSKPHPAGDTSVADNMANLIFPVFTDCTKRNDGDGTRNPLQCIRAGKEPKVTKSAVPSTTPTITTSLVPTSRDALAGPTVAVRAEHVLGVAAVAAGWGVI